LPALKRKVQVVMNNPSTATLEDISSDHDCANAHSDEGDWFLAMKGITFDEVLISRKKN